jgi:hypothetical protein
LKICPQLFILHIFSPTAKSSSEIGHRVSVSSELYVIEETHRSISRLFNRPIVLVVVAAAVVSGGIVLLDESTGCWVVPVEKYHGLYLDSRMGSCSATGAGAGSAAGADGLEVFIFVRNN